MNFVIIIPARFSSTRLPGKPLANINGKPMISYVINIAKKTKAKRIIVATDHFDIVKTVKKIGCEVCMTSTIHKSGIERISEVINQYDFPDETIIVNIQSDEPLLSPDIIIRVIKKLIFSNLNVATLAIPIHNVKDLFNPNVVKVIINKKKYAIYFSRTAIPFNRNNFFQLSLKKNTFDFLRHIGVYVYRAKFIRDYIQWKPSNIEKIEMLEQLRILWYGEKIYIKVSKNSSATNYVSVDTIQDLNYVRSILKK